MCSIIGSFSKDKLLELVKLNSSRGEFSHSLTTIDPNTLECNTIKNFGSFNEELLQHVSESDYLLAHNQAPTGGLIKDEGRIHPAVIGDLSLWHNGMLKSKEIKRLNTKYCTYIQWDTMLMLQSITEDGIIPSLRNMDGSFACVLIEEFKSFKIFRNQSSPLYIDDNMNISSRGFEGSKMLAMNYMYNGNFAKRCFERQDHFLNKNAPYFFTDEDSGILDGPPRSNT
jgi:hypothetical protein